MLMPIEMNIHELQGLTDEERSIFHGAVGYLMRQQAIQVGESPPKPLWYMSVLLKMVHRLAKERRETATQRAERLGFDLSKVKENPAEFDMITGKRGCEE